MHSVLEKNTSLLGYWTFSSHHFCSSQFTEFTAQLLTISSHHLSLQYCLISATCLYTHLNMVISEVLMTRRANTVISFLFFSSHSLSALSFYPSLAGYFTPNLQSVTISSVVISVKLIFSPHNFLSYAGISNSTFCINLNMFYDALPFFCYFATTKLVCGPIVIMKTH